MNRIAFCLIALFFAFNSYGQGFIHLKKERARKKLENYGARKKLNAHIQETDSSLVFLLRDSSVRPMDFIVVFDTDGKCKTETQIWDCDSCLQKYKAKVLNNKSYKWKKISGSLYVSKFSKGLYMDTSGESLFTITFRRFDFSKKEYVEYYGKN